METRSVITCRNGTMNSIHWPQTVSMSALVVWSCDRTQGTASIAGPLQIPMPNDHWFQKIIGLFWPSVQPSCFFVRWCQSSDLQLQVSSNLELVPLYSARVQKRVCKHFQYCTKNGSVKKKKTIPTVSLKYFHLQTGCFSIPRTAKGFHPIASDPWDPRCNARHWSGPRLRRRKNATQSWRGDILPCAYLMLNYIVMGISGYYIKLYYVKSHFLLYTNMIF